METAHEGENMNGNELGTNGFPAPGKVKLLLH
jgi:hypothetical protein